MSGPYVTVDPAVAFGRPTMRGIPTGRLADAHWAGDHVEEEYELTRHELLVAL